MAPERASSLPARPGYDPARGRIVRVLIVAGIYALLPDLIFARELPPAAAPAAVVDVR